MLNRKKEIWYQTLSFLFVIFLFDFFSCNSKVCFKYPLKQCFFPEFQTFQHPWKAAYLTQNHYFFSYNVNVRVINGIWMSLLFWVASVTKSHRGQTSKWNAEALQSSKISIKLNSKAWGSACELLYKLWMTEPSRHITHSRKLGGWSDR